MSDDNDQGGPPAYPQEKALPRVMFTFQGVESMLQQTNGVSSGHWAIARNECQLRCAGEDPLPVLHNGDEAPPERIILAFDGVTAHAQVTPGVGRGHWAIAFQACETMARGLMARDLGPMLQPMIMPAGQVPRGGLVRS